MSMTEILSGSNSEVSCSGLDMDAEKKRPSTDASIPSPPGKKYRKMTNYDTDPVSNSSPNSLDTLPYVVNKSLLLYLDVESLENLSSTCSLFQNLVAEKFNTSLDLACPEFFTQLMESDAFNKPLLKVMLSKHIVGIDAKEEALNTLESLNLDYVRVISLVEDSSDLTLTDEWNRLLFETSVIDRIAR